MEGAADAPICSICQDSLLVREHLPDGGGTVSITACNHYFHTTCLRVWFARNPTHTCPYCRTAGGDIYEADVAVRQEHAEQSVYASASASHGPLYAHLDDSAADGADKASSAVVIVADADEPAGSAAEPSQPEPHPLIAADMSMDELRAQGYSDAEVASMGICFRDAVRLGLRKEHFASGWLALERASVLFSGATWPALCAEIGYVLADALPPGATAARTGAPAAPLSDATQLGEGGLSARALGRLGETAASLRARGELTREMLLTLPYLLREWIDELRLTRDDLDALALRPADYVALSLCGRGWTSRILMAELGFERRTLIEYRVVRDYSTIDLKI